MDRRQGSSEAVNKRRLRRKKIIWFWCILKSFFNWLRCVVTFKKCIVVFCIYYVTDIINYWKLQNELGNYVSDTVIVAVITAFIVELGLTALTSIKEQKNVYGDDKDYG